MRRLPVKLHQNEELLGVIRRSLLSRARKIVIAVVWILIPFFFFFPLLQLGGSGLGIFIFLLAGGIIYLVRQYLIWANSLLIITDQRLIDVDQRALTAREINEVILADVSEVTCLRRGLWNSLFNLGTIHVATKSSRGYDLELSGVRRPEKVRDLLDEVQYMRNYGRKVV